MTSYLYGAVLLLEPEQDAVFDHDCCAKMKHLGMNTVVIWPPAIYERGEPRFERQLRLLDIAAEYGLKVIVELTGQVAHLEYLPDSRYRDEYAVRNFDGSVEKMQNGLGELNYNHPFVKESVRSFFHAAAQAMKDHPALYGWDIWNESHFLSFDAWTLAEFRRWLSGKYDTIDHLNAIWKKSYASFDQIEFTKVTWASIMSEVDWEEFRTDNLAAIAAEWHGWMKEADPAHPVIADNVMSNVVWGETSRGSDDWKLARSVDRYGISFYPKTGGRLLKENAPWLRSMTFAGASSAGRGSFVISEMQSHYYSEIFTAERVTPDELIDWNLEAITQGCAGCIYWKWNPFKTGFQLGGRGLVLADGSLSKRAAAAAQLGELFTAHPELAQLRPYSSAGIMFDRHNKFTVKTINNRIKHLIGDDQPVRASSGLYRLGWERNLPLRFVTPETLTQDLSGLKVIFLPYQVSLDLSSCEQLRRFVHDGGIMVANYPFVDIGNDGRLFERLPGGPLNDLIGATHLDNLVAGTGDDALEIQELRLADGAEVLAEIDGMPLIFRRRHGLGQVIYAAAAIWNLANDSRRDNFGTLILDLLRQENPELAPVKSNVHADLMAGPDADYLLLANYDGIPECRVELPTGYDRVESIFGTGAMTQDGLDLCFSSARMELIKLRRKA